MLNVEDTIERAKGIYPLGFFYKGMITEEEMTELEKVCDVQCSSVYMNGEENTVSDIDKINNIGNIKVLFLVGE